MSSASGELRPGDSEPPPDGRLDSWKEIAAHLRRSVRSAKRWEKEDGLPVRRHLHGKRDSVYAYRTELDTWWTNRERKVGDQTVAADAASPPQTETLGASGVEEPEREGVPSPSSRPSRRGALIGVGFGLAIVLVGLVAWLSRNGASPSAGSLQPLPFKARDWILVADFENRTGEPLLDGTVEYALEREVSESRYVNVVPRQRVVDVLRLMRKPPDTRVDAALGREICIRDGGIRALLTGRIEKSGSNYLLSIVLVDPTGGASVATFAEEGDGRSGIPEVIRRSSHRLREILGEAAIPLRQGDEELASVTTPSLTALQVYSKADLLIEQMKSGAAEELLRQAVAEDPGFASAHIHLAWAMRNQGRPQADWKESAEAALRLSATTTERERYFIRGSYYELLHEERKAIAAYQALLSLYPDHFWGTRNLSVLYRSVGRSAEAVALTVRKADMRPNDFFANVQAAWDLSIQARDPVRAGIYANRALRLVSVETAEEMPEVVGWVETFAASKAWSEGNMPRALQEADHAAAKIASFTGLAREALADYVALSYMALGRLVDAERSYAEISDPILRHERLSRISFVRNDTSELRNHLQAMGKVNFRRLATVMLFARAGLLPQARQAAADMNRNSPTGAFELAQGEIALAGGDIDKALANLEDAVNRDSPHPWGFLLGSESLAAALMKKGDVAQAVRTLERATGKRTSAGFENAGFLWLRTRFALAQLYRRSGRDQDARMVERELSVLLVFADSDHPIRRELDRLKGS